MSNELVAPLPVRVVAVDDESGIGRLARTLWANGTTFRRAEAWLHVALNRPWRDADVRTLAWATQTSFEWLSHRSFLHPEARADKWCRFAGHALRSAASPPGRSARMCCRCVRERGYCKASWLIRAIPGGAVHGLLTDACRHCGRRIAWDRPAIDVCTCGRYLVTEPAEEGLSTRAAAWTRWLESRLGFSQEHANAKEASLPLLLDRLSVDGASRLVEAFGLLRKPADSTSGATAAARTASGCAAMIERGLRRLAVVDGDPAAMRLLVDEVHLPALERLRSNATCDADSACAALLLRKLQFPQAADVDMRGRHGRGQRRLFE